MLGDLLEMGETRLVAEEDEAGSEGKAAAEEIKDAYMESVRSILK